MRQIISALPDALLPGGPPATAQTARERVSFDDDRQFPLGEAHGAQPPNCDDGIASDAVPIEAE